MISKRILPFLKIKRFYFSIESDTIYEKLIDRDTFEDTIIKQNFDS
jgi:hypothetical protein